MVRDTSSFTVIKNILLTESFADNHQLLIGLSPSRQKACTTRGQGVNAGQIRLEMTKLMLHRFADHVDARSLLLCHGQELFPGLLAVCAWLMAKAFSDLQMHCIDQQ